MRFQLNLLVLFSCCCSLIMGQNGRQRASQQCDALTIRRPNNQNICIGIRTIDKFFQSIRQSRSLSTGVTTEVLGLAIADTTAGLARGLNLTRDEIENQLPTISTDSTGIRSLCPAKMLRPHCTAERYRSIDGSCNNLNNAHYGAVESPLTRLLPPLYADGLKLQRVSVTGAALPNVRQISTLVHRDSNLPDRTNGGATVFLPAYGQLIGHDMNHLSLTGSIECCQNIPLNRQNPACGTISYPANDPFFSRFRQTCLNFPIVASGLRVGCRLGSKTPFNLVSSFLDASFLYGSDTETAEKLRSRRNGLLKTDPAPRRPGLKELLPPQIENPDMFCARTDRTKFCTFAGDFRSSQTPMMIVGHTLFLREHNRIARELFRINPHWNDEKIYQETRRIIGAIVQHITYKEFLPNILGPNLLSRYQLVLQEQGMTNFYDSSIDPTLPAAFNGAAYRFGHSLIPSKLERWSTDHSRTVASEHLSDLFGKPFNDEGGTLDQYIGGHLNQVPQSVDEAMTEELTNQLFPAAGSGFGQDLASRNIARGRDQGLPGYNAYRRFCGQAPVTNWNDLVNVFTNTKTLEAYRELYASVDDIDLWSAGISERHAPGSRVGQVFACIIGLTFQRLKKGDRFWYENGGQPSSFTQGQLNEIRKVSLSRMICDNSENIQTVQRNAFRLANQNSNPRVSCATIPGINLEQWRSGAARAPINNNNNGRTGRRRNLNSPRTSRIRVFTDYLNEYLNLN